MFGSLEWNVPWSEYLHFLHFLICLSSLNITYYYHSHHLKVHHGFKHPCECIKPYVTKTHNYAIHKDLITLLLSHLVSFLVTTPSLIFYSLLIVILICLLLLWTCLKFKPHLLCTNSVLLAWTCLIFQHHTPLNLGSLTRLRPTPIQLNPTITLILYSTVPANADILYSHLAQQHLCSCSTQTYQYYNTLPTAAQASYKPSETE